MKPTCYFDAITITCAFFRFKMRLVMLLKSYAIFHDQNCLRKLRMYTCSLIKKWMTINLVLGGIQRGVWVVNRFGEEAFSVI